MKKMNPKIGTRILAGYLAALVVFAGVGLIAYRAVNELSNAAALVTHTYKVKEALTGVLSSLADAETGQRGYLLTNEERYLEPYESGIRVVDRYIQDLRDLTGDNRNQQRRVANLQALVARKLSALADAITARRREGEKAALNIILSDRGRRDMEEIRKVIAEMDSEETGRLRQREKVSDETHTFATAAILGGGLVAAALVVLVSLLVQRSITGPLNTFMAFAQRVGQGDLTQQAVLTGDDELGELSEDLNEMVVGLRDVARQAWSVAENLNAATSEILASTQQQAASTAEQAAAVQQANATMAELSQSGAQISERAKQVATAAEAVTAASATGLQSVKNTSTTMEAIREQAEAVAENVISLSEKTQAVGEIIATVNDIAEQSHLLALNAAIQAAQAGEHGRSFSVVAAEMKNLAAQSKEATVQVRSILGDIQKGIATSVMLTEEAVKRAGSGKQQASGADQAIRQLSEKLEDSIRAFQQIVAGSAQQQIGFDQVTQAFRNIAVASQETASSTKQSEAAADNLSSLARQLREVVGRYRV